GLHGHRRRPQHPGDLRRHRRPRLWRGGPERHAGPDRGGCRPMNPSPPFATVSIYWQLPILIIVISLVYSATRYDQWSSILHEALRWGLRMSAFLLAIGVVLFVLATFI